MTKAIPALAQKPACNINARMTIFSHKPLMEGLSVKSISIVLAHGLFIGDTEEKLKKRKIKKIVTSNTVFNEFMQVDCANEIVKKLEQLIK